MINPLLDKTRTYIHLVPGQTKDGHLQLGEDREPRSEQANISAQSAGIPGDVCILSCNKGF